MPASGKMYRYAYSILKEKETATDVVQECLMKIWDKRNRLIEIQNPESWAMRITRNQCYDWVRLNRFTLMGEQEISHPDTIAADDEAIENDHLKWLDEILQTFPEKQREIFYLREIEDMTYQDIAEILSVSLAEVKVTLHRTRARIKEKMQKIESYGIAN